MERGSVRRMTVLGVSEFRVKFVFIGFGRWLFGFFF